MLVHYSLLLSAVLNQRTIFSLEVTPDSNHQRALSCSVQTSIVDELSFTLHTVISRDPLAWLKWIQMLLPDAAVLLHSGQISLWTSSACNSIKMVETTGNVIFVVGFASKLWIPDCVERRKYVQCYMIFPCSASFRLQDIMTAFNTQWEFKTEKEAVET